LRAKTAERIRGPRKSKTGTRRTVGKPGEKASLHWVERPGRGCVSCRGEERGKPDEGRNSRKTKKQA